MTPTTSAGAVETASRKRLLFAGWLGVKVLAVFSVFGVLGLLGAGLLRWRAGPGSRFSHVGQGAVAVGFLVLLAGAGWRSVEVFTGIDECRPPPEIERYATEQAAEAAISISPLEQVMTWPISGVAMLYGRAAGAEICYFEAHKYYRLTFERWPLSRGSFFVGNVLMSRPLEDKGVDRVLELSGHEVKHRRQWAVATVIAGPLAFPAAYSIDNLFFPDAANHFERAAGLEEGGYDTDRTAPLLGWQEWLLVGGIIAGIEFAWLAMRGKWLLRGGRQR